MRNNHYCLWFCVSQFATPPCVHHLPAHHLALGLRVIFFDFILAPTVSFPRILNGKCSSAVCTLWLMNKIRLFYDLSHKVREKKVREINFNLFDFGIRYADLSELWIDFDHK